MQKKSPVQPKDAVIEFATQRDLGATIAAEEKASTKHRGNG